jgi:cell wall-associated NlpC family hydrolase
MSSHCAQRLSAQKASTFAVIGATAMVTLIVTQNDAHADVPAQAQADYDQKMNAAAAADEDFDAAIVQAAKLQQKIDALQAQISSDTWAMGSLQRSMGLQAALQYQDPGLSGLELALDSSPAAYLNKALLSNEIATGEARMLRSLAADRARIAADQQFAAGALAEQKAAVATARSRKNNAFAEAEQAREIFDRLSAVQQQAITQADGGVSPSRVHITSVAPNARAAEAVAYAESKVGDPYVYGAAGPGAFDCSGLTMMAWARAGVSLPHDAAAQASMLTQVSLSYVEPGDLVFYSYDGRDIAHVAIYVGGGMVVHAPRPGESVQYGSVHTVGPIVEVGRVAA